MDISALESREAEIKAQIQKIKDTAKLEERDINDDEAERLDELATECEGVQSEISATRKRLDAIARAEAVTRPKNDPAPPAHRSPAYTRESVLDDPKHGWGSLHEMALAIKDAGPDSGALDKRLRIVAAATGLSVGIGAEGGFLIAPEFSEAIWEGVSGSSASLLNLTDNYVVTGKSLSFNANAETSRANGSRWGGVRGYWLGETTQITSSKPKVRELTLKPQKLGVLVYATDDLLDQGNPSAERFLRQAATDEINFMVGDAIVNGNGAGKPLGLMNASAKVQVTRGTASTFVQQDVANMWARIPARSMPTAVWLIEQSVLPELLTMTTPVTNVAGTENVGGFNTKLYNPDTNTLMGRPVILTEYNAALGTSGDVILWDPMAYAVGTRGTVDTAASIHLRFDYNETAFRFLFHVDGQPWLQSALTPKSAGDTLSTIVDLS